MPDDIQNHPLVSVVVASYNSDRWILETLDSIARQTYQHLELIITDDASTDDTVQSAQSWLDEHAGRFVHTRLIRSEDNTGVTCNCNRGFRACQGEYIKLIGADDMLLPGAIHDLLQGMMRQQGDIAFCYEYVFYPEEKSFLGTEREKELEVRPRAIGIYACSQESMYKRLLSVNQFPAPTSMIRRAVYEELGGFDERYAHMEDYPFWLKAIRGNAKIVFVKTYGVYYRKFNESCSWREDAPTLHQKNFQECLDRFTREVRDPEMKRLKMKPGPAPSPAAQPEHPANINEWERKVLSFNGRLSCMGIPRILRCWLLLLAPRTAVYKIKTRVFTVVRARFGQLHTKLRAKKDQLLRKVRDRLYAAKPGALTTVGLQILKCYDYRHAVAMIDDPNSKKGWLSLYWNAMKLERAYARRRTGEKKRILFAVHLLFAFSAIESIYLAVRERPDLEAVLLLIPGRQPGMDHRWFYAEGLKEYMEKKGYPYHLGYENGKWRNVLEWDPDGVFYQTPYYAQRHPVYNPKYARAYPKLMYTPYGPWVMDKSVTEYINAGIDRPYFNQLWRFFADKLTCEMVESAAPEYLPVTVQSGSPKVDFHRAMPERADYCWNLPVDEQHKRIIWMPRWGVEGGRTSFLDFYAYFLDFIGTHPQIDFVMRPHPFLFKDLKRSGTFTITRINQIKASFESFPNACIDYGADYREGLLSCDFIISDFSSIIYEYLPTNKPLIYTRKDNTLVEPRIMNACYVVTALDELRAAISMLLRDEDPLRQKRLAIVEDLSYFPHGFTDNGHCIADYIATNLK